MKNLHILPTTPNDETANGIWIKETRDWCNIYITNDEEIKIGDWYFKDGVVGKCDKYPDIINGYNVEKIILTTDQDLIKDGVQAIDDDFLEWFVKNSSCKRVEVDKEYNEERIVDGKDIGDYSYKIFLPQEETKQETLTYSEAAKKEERLFNSTMIFKQEKLEEAAENYVRNESDDALKLVSKYSFKDGAKWQAERMYSLDEILKSFDNLGFKQISSEELNSLPYQPFITDEDGNIWVIDKEKWFQSFKKKV